MNTLEPTTFEITSCQHCIEVAHQLKDNLSSFQRYQIHQAVNFFKNNIKAFNIEDVDLLMAHPLFKKHIKADISVTLIEHYIDHGKPMPFLMEELFSCPIKLKEKYACILNEANCLEQMKVFHSREPLILKSLYSNRNHPQSAALIEIILQDSPWEIFNNRTWDAPRVVQWLDENKEKIPQIIGFNAKMVEHVHSTIKKKIYEVLADFLCDEKSYLRDKEQGFRNMDFTVCKMAQEFLLFLQDRYPSQILQYLQSPSEIRDSMQQTSVRMNKLQYMLSYINSIGSHRWDDVVISNMELCLQPIDQYIEFHHKVVDPFDYFLQEKGVSFIKVMSCHMEHLTENHQKICTAIFFYSLRDDSRELDMQWLQHMVFNTPAYIFDDFYDKNIGCLGMEAIQQTEMLKLTRNMGKILPVNDKNKKAKNKV